MGKIHIEILRLRPFHVTPAIAVGSRRDIVNEHKIGYIRHVSLMWMSWELRFFTIKTKVMRIGGNEYMSYFKGIERSNRIDA